MKKNKKHISFSKLLNSAMKPFLFFLGLILLAAVLFDLYCETVRFPSFLTEKIREKVSKKGINMEFKEAKGGIFSGLILKNMSVKDSNIKDFEIFNADNARFSISPDFGKIISFDRIFISKGKLRLPIFPEAGEEGADEILTFDKINTEIEINGKDVKIIHSDFTFGDFSISASGAVRRVFSIPGGNDSENGEKYFKPYFLLSSIPMENRCRIAKFFYGLKKIRFNGTPTFRMTAEVDAANLPGSVIESSFQIPDFKYENFSFKSIQGELGSKNGGVFSEHILVQTTENDFFNVSNFSYNISGQKLKAALTADINPDMFKPYLKQFLPSEEFSFGGRKVSITAIVNDFSFLSNFYQGNIELKIPEARFRGDSYSDIIVSSSVSTCKEQPDLISVGGLKVDVAGSLSSAFDGVFDRRKKTLSGSVSGFFFPLKILGILKAGSTDERLSLLSFGTQPVVYRGKLELPFTAPEDMACAVKIEVPELKVRDVVFKPFSGEINVSGGNFAFDRIEAVTDDSIVHGNFSIFPKSNEVLISIQSSGKPSYITGLSDKKDTEFLCLMYNSFDWPENRDNVDFSVNIHYTMGENPYYMLSGTIAVSDFSYNKAKFKYGASTFYADSDNVMIFPNIILQKNDSRALFALVFDARKAGTAPAVQSSYFEGVDTDTDKMLIELDSNIPGNDLLKCVFPQSKKEWPFSFTCPTPVEMNGSIDFKHQNNSIAEGGISNASCSFWNKFSLENVNAKVMFKNSKMQVVDMTARVYDGKINTDYTYDYHNNTGDIALKLENAQFAPIMKSIGMELSSSHKSGLISGNLNSDLSFTEKDDIIMNGRGNISIKDATIWEIPYLKSFAQLLEKTHINIDWDEISSVECLFVLDGDHFFTDSFRTDGKVIALSGTGKYYWNTKETDIRMRAKLLKNLLPFELIPKLFDPVSWFFEARLYGKAGKLKWEEKSAVRDLFR